MNIETLLEQPFNEIVKAQLAQKAVIAGLIVPEGHLQKAFDFYKSKGDYFVAADIADELGDKEKRKLMLNNAANKLIKTKAQKKVEFDKVMARIDAGDYYDSKKENYHHRVDYEVIAEDGGLMAMGVLGPNGFNSLGDLLGVERTEGKSFDWGHVQAIRSVLRGDLDDAKEMYTKLLERAAEASDGGKGFIRTHTLDPIKEATLALEIGEYDKAYEIFDKHNMNHYGAILAKIQGDFDKANELFDKQIERTISTKSPKGNIRGVKVGGHINYYHAASIAEMKGDLSKQIEMLAMDNKYQDLIKMVDEGEASREVIEPLIVEIRNQYIEESSGVSLMDEGIGKLEAAKIWNQYGFSNLELLNHVLKTKKKMFADNTVSYVSKVSDRRLFEVALHTKIAADMTDWLGNKEEATKLKKVAYTFSEKADSHLTPELAIELNDRKLMEANLKKIEGRENEYGKQGGRIYSNERRNLLIALERYDEALEGAEGFDKRYTLEKAGRWGELCDALERREFRDDFSEGPLEAYKIAVEHGLTERADRLYGKIVEERKDKGNFAYYDIVPIIIEREDNELAKQVVNAAKEELFALPKFGGYAVNRLANMLPLAEYSNDSQAMDLFTIILPLGKLKSRTVIHKYDLEGIKRNTENEIKVELLRPIARYEKYVKPLLEAQ